VPKECGLKLSQEVSVEGCKNNGQNGTRARTRLLCEGSRRVGLYTGLGSVKRMHIRPTEISDAIQISWQYEMVLAFINIRATTVPSLAQLRRTRITFLVKPFDHSVEIINKMQLCNRIYYSKAF
jgi:hypothetical protein